MAKKKGNRAAKNSRHKMTDPTGKEEMVMDSARGLEWQPEAAATGESPLDPEWPLTRPGRLWGAKSAAADPCSLSLAEPQTAQDSPNTQIRFLTNIDAATTSTTTLARSLLPLLPIISQMVPRITWRGLEGVRR